MEKFELIQKYLHNELSSEERNSFEKEVQANKELAMELELQRFELETIEQLEEDSLREKANQLKKQFIEENDTNIAPIKKERNNRRILLWAVAASVALLAMYFMFRPKENLSSNLFAYSYGQARLDYGNRLSKSSNTQESIFPATYTEILKNREHENAEDAIEFFTSFSTDNETANTQAHLNLGHALILNEQYKESIQVFSDVQNSSEVTQYQKEEAQLFYALSLYADEQKDEAISSLQNLSQEGESFEILARKVLEKVK